MATANTYLQVTELDFNQIRNNLKEYLSAQDDFADYDYEGSTMATLLDVLAYNTHYNAYYLNMLANEMFLDTAQQRESVVSRAKELGYTPASAQGASATLNVSFAGIPADTAEITIPKNSTFTSTIDDVTYTFVTPQAYSITNDGGVFASTITVKEGEPLTYRWTVDTSNPVRYIIPNANVDASSISVYVQESVTDTTSTEFVLASDISQIYSTSPVYFLEEAGDGKYEVVFGSGALGRTPINGNVIIISYLVCNGEATNGASTFTKESVILNNSITYTSMTATTNTVARGGRAAETIDSIKFNAPKHYQTQNRAVIGNDYQRIIVAENSDIQSAVAFGGELASPPVYGKVYIAIKPFGEQYATASRKNEIRLSIIDRTPLGIDPVMIDPDYTYLVPTITTYYDTTATRVPAGQIQAAIRSAVSTFATNNLERFGNRLRYSRFIRTLDNVTVGSILNNDASIKMQKRFVPNTQRAEKVELSFSNEIRPGTLTSTQFTYNGYDAYLDDTDGAVNIYRYTSDKQKTYITRGVGTIDYTAGTVTVEGFMPTAYLGIEMKVSASPVSFDIIPVREQILMLQSGDVTVNVVGEAS